MNRTLHDVLNRWMRSEEADRATEAEAWLGEVFAVLPRKAPRAGFTDRVLARTRLLQAPAPPEVVAPWITAAAAILVCASGALLVATLPPFSPQAAAHGLARGIGRLASALVDGISTGLDLWAVLTDVSNALTVVASTPTVLIFLTVSTLAGLASLRLLYGLTAPDRSLSYANSAHA